MAVLGLHCYQLDFRIRTQPFNVRIQKIKSERIQRTALEKKMPEMWIVRQVNRDKLHGEEVVSRNGFRYAT
jgi:hypothetical protein